MVFAATTGLILLVHPLPTEDPNQMHLKVAPEEMRANVYTVHLGIAPRFMPRKRALAQMLPSNP